MKCSLPKAIQRESLQVMLSAPLRSNNTNANETALAIIPERRKKSRSQNSCSYWSIT
ncbi:hypothetical protein AB4359_02315 [Vibrio splendidus]